MFSCKFAAYFQNTFSEEYLWTAASDIWQSTDRSSHQRCFIKKAVLRNFTKFIEKHLRQGLFFNKVAPLRPATFLKKRFWDRCFPVNFAKLLRTTFLQNTSGRLFPYRSSHRKCSEKIGVLKNFANFIGKYLCWGLSLIKFSAGLKACNFIKKRLQHWYFPLKFAKFLRTPTLKNICEHCF